ncbi:MULTISPECIES: ferritin-like domain-containing protein [unclassified Aureispira]|uniref:ferritin-like domain-containing protein n=1 Tax=unclassified Aureispira TaxID=2649989 RepID=UPI0018CC2F74|nr:MULTISPECIES: ferritin-like domain-containing protein [unclassified Aureispira]WMX12320.1 ferritin-like domain-containing protein [Aureispira sp. CCB-E]
MTKKLNVLLATYKIYAHKLLNYQWLIQSSKHPELNEELDIYCEEAERQIESIIDQIISLGGMPLGSWAKWQRASDIKFKIPNRDFRTILQGVIDDSKTIRSSARNLENQAEKNKQLATAQLAQQIQAQLASRISDVQNKLHLI